MDDLIYKSTADCDAKSFIEVEIIGFAHNGEETKPIFPIVSVTENGLIARADPVRIDTKTAIYSFPEITEFILEEELTWHLDCNYPEQYIDLEIMMEGNK